MTMSPSRTTAYPATGRLRRAVIQLTCCPRFRIKGTQPSRGASTDQVDGGEQADPHDIDEVPVIGHDDGADLLFLSDFPGCVGAPEQEEERDEPAGDMEAVEPGRNVEHRPVAAGRQRQVLFADQVEVLIPLAEDEVEAHEEREDVPLAQAPLAGIPDRTGAPDLAALD